MSTITQKKTTIIAKPIKVESIEELPTNPFSFEVLNLAVKQRSNVKKIEVLKKYEHPSLKALFIWNFDESIISVLPPGQVPYAETSEQNSFSGTLSEKIDDAGRKILNENGTIIGFVVATAETWVYP